MNEKFIVGMFIIMFWLMIIFCSGGINVLFIIVMIKFVVFKVDFFFKLFKVIL